MENMAKIFDQFHVTLNVIADHAETTGKSQKNMTQPLWLVFGESHDSRKDLLEPLDRVEINEHFKQIDAKLDQVTLTSPIATAIQHDFIAGVARDVFHLRRSRLHRLFCRIPVSEGMGGKDGAVHNVLKQFVANMVENDR